MGAVRCQESTLFNSFLTTIKLQYSEGRHRAMWELLGSDSNRTELTLISSDEDAFSRVSPTEAAQFFVEKTVIGIVAPVAAPVEAEDDLFDDMA